MRALRALSLTIATALIFTAPAAAQRMSPGLVNDLREVEVQRALIALGSLDATPGRASRRELREAIEWFRRGYKLGEGLNPLTPGEREKLKEIYKKFETRTGLQPVPHKGAEFEVNLPLPVAFVGKTPQKGLGQDGKEWLEYRAGDNSVSVGPEIHLLSQFTPIALFRERIMSASLKYRYLHLTSEEFAAQGDVGSDSDGFSSSSLVLTSKDRLKGAFMRYAKNPPAGFEVPDFLLPMLPTETLETGATQPDQTTRGWQLLMQGVANLVTGDFPFHNGWTQVSTKPCRVSQDAGDGQAKNIRILFGTDRKAIATPSTTGRIANPDSLFANEPDNRLHLGCAYVSVPAIKEGEETRDLRKSTIVDYRWLHTTEKADFGDQLYLTDEIGEGSESQARENRSRESKARRGRGVNAGALVFIHGYNVAFADALFTVSQLVAATDYPGRVYMYSWPSAARTLGYIGDMDNAEQAEPFLQSFMKLLMRDADIDEIDILVHSMGSQSVLRALSALRAVFETERQGAARPKAIRIGQIMFAAPDVAMPVFDQKIRRIAPYADRVTVYASSTDSALLASKLLRSGANRMGELNNDGQPLRVEIKNVHVIDATGPERWWRLDRILFGQGHDYFRQSPGVLKDIQQILKATGEGQRTTPKERSGTRFEEVAFKEDKDWVFWKLKEK